MSYNMYYATRVGYMCTLKCTAKTFSLWPILSLYAFA